MLAMASRIIEGDDSLQAYLALVGFLICEKEALET